MKYAEHIVDLVGNTPLVKLNAVTEGIDSLGHASVRVRAIGGSDGRLNAQHGSGGAAIALLTELYRRPA